MVLSQLTIAFGTSLYDSELGLVLTRLTREAVPSSYPSIFDPKQGSVIFLQQFLTNSNCKIDLGFWLDQEQGAPTELLSYWLIELTTLSTICNNEANK